MELVILIAAVVVVLGYFIWKDRTLEASGSHPLENVTKKTEITVAPVLTQALDLPTSTIVEAAEPKKTRKAPAKKEAAPKKAAAPKKPAAPKKAAPKKAPAKKTTK